MKQRSLELTYEDINKRGLMRDGKHFPYNPHNLEKAKRMRKKMTKAEFILRTKFLKDHTYKFYRQRPIDHFIVDFYCSQADLIIEVDGDTHYTDDGKAYDTMRTELLELYGLHVIRFTNFEVIDNLEQVCKVIDTHVYKSPHPTSPQRGGAEGNEAEGYE